MRCDGLQETCLAAVGVSIHAPTWGATPATCENSHTRRSFNPRTYMRCDSYKKRYLGRYRVSIHAPTWGATGYCLKYGVGLAVSIHAPTWGATDNVTEFYVYNLSFNPRTYMRCDYYVRCLANNLTMFQSTHLHEVRLRGLLLRLVVFLCFNPRTYMRCDCIVNNWLTNIVQRYTFREYMQSYVIEKASCLMWYLICW